MARKKKPARNPAFPERAKSLFASFADGVAQTVVAGQKPPMDATKLQKAVSDRYEEPHEKALAAHGGDEKREEATWQAAQGDILKAMVDIGRYAALDALFEGKPVDKKRFTSAAKAVEKLFGPRKAKTTKSKGRGPCPYCP